MRQKYSLLGPAAIAALSIALTLFAVFQDPAGAQVKTSPYYSEPADNRTASQPNDPFPFPPELVGVELLKQTDAEAQRKSAGCVHCHQNVGDPHCKDTLRIGCVDCHGGNPDTTDKLAAHVPCRFPEAWTSSANPVRSYTLLNHESPEYIRFVNPGDFRIAHISCGTIGCHSKEVATNRKQIMTSGAMLWGAALYNNGSVPYKRARHGEFYSMNGAALRAVTVPAPTEEECTKKGVVPFLDPLPRFEMSQPGNLLRIFERGGQPPAEVGIPNPLEIPGRPAARLSARGLGTQNRTDPVFVSLNKTRLFDALSFLGTNDHPGDYRSSGCTACHVVYANDRSPVHSGPYAKFGNCGISASQDPTIPKNESGHPIEHRFTTGVPTSQCIVCHVHPGTSVMNSYCGYIWWDEETEGKHMYPEKEKKLTAQDYVRAQMLNPDEAAARGKWINPEFLANLANLNSELEKTQFADFHGHGWVFRAVFKHDRTGELLDAHGEKIEDVTAEKLQKAIRIPEFAKELYRNNDKLEAIIEAEERFKNERKGTPVHLLDVHLEKGMHCVDCHFVQDMHGNGRLHMEVRAACEIQCVDCHGTIGKKASLRTSGPASYTSSKEGGRDLRAMRTPFGKPRFEIEGDRIIQNSMVEKGIRWDVKQVRDTIDPSNKHYNEKSRLAKTVRIENGQMVWGDTPDSGCKLAHCNENMSCIACHSSWNPSCYGCHLPQRANLKMPHVHWDGDVTRNYTPYNFQTLRDDVYMLARDGDVTGNRIGPARSSCAIHVGSYNQNRESIYVQQQTISAEGLSGIAFSTNVPHTVRGAGKYETRQCTDCHVSKQNDNNAWMAQLLMHGTNSLNFVGRYAWVAAGDHGLAGVEVTERDEPQAVIGSGLHEHAFPKRYEEFVKGGRKLEHAHEHPGPDIKTELLKPFKKHEVLQVQNRGEYLYAACGEAGVRVYDIAFIDNKAFSERITTAPVSPMGQRFFVETKYAVAVAAPCTPAPDPTRTHRPENKEQKVPALYGFLYVADKYEGLVLIGAATTIDGNPTNNFLERKLAFNPDGLLCGATNIAIVGNYAYVTCLAGLVVVSLEDPEHPKVKHVVGDEFLKHPKGVQAQFRYAYCWDDEGIKVLDISDLEHPRPSSVLHMADVHSVYLARTYAYVAAGASGLVILDITVPDCPKVDQIYNAEGKINDCRDVKLGITYVSQFAYLADGKNGMRVVQLMSPETPGNDGFSPRPTPKLVATFPIPHKGKALSVAKGLDRDRAVDESGNQIGVFGRVGARPLNADEQKKMYLRDGRVWFVGDDPNDRSVFPPPRELQK